jgi:ABC-type uncharacterized transport system ATPase subunit
MHLTVIPSDKQIYLETSDTQYPNRRCHIIDNDSEFWNNVDPRIHAIQYHSDGLKQIEYKNPREDIAITDISTIQKYVDRFNLTEQTYQSQIAWDNNNVQVTLEDNTQRAETREEKIIRLGSRP